MSFTESLDELNILALESIAAHLNNQGFPPWVVEGVVAVEIPGAVGLVCRCEVVSPPGNTHRAIVPVAIELSYTPTDAAADRSDTRTINEMVVGLSLDPREAVLQATHNWCEGVFPPIRRVFDPTPPSAEDDDSAYPFNIATKNLETGVVTDWNLFLGRVQVGGVNSEPFAEFLAQGKIVHLLMNALTSLANDVRLHWVKVYVAFQADGSARFECKLDNEDWPEGVSELSRIRWPRVKDFVQYRQFLILRPSDTAPPDVRQQLEKFSAQQQSQTPEPAVDVPKKRRGWWPFGR